MDRKFKFGDIVQHFKRETISDKFSNMYLYKIIGDSYHTETGEHLMNYVPLYECSTKMFSRPYEQFMSEVDHEKYPDIKQKYRFSLYHKK